MFRIECENPLPSKCCEHYSGLAYDGCWLYLTIRCECKIQQMDSSFHRKQSFETSRIYNKICYDPSLKCFWASSDKCGAILYKLNECFQEIDCIKIDNHDVDGGVVTGIAYNCCQNTLIVSFASAIISMNKEHPKDNTTIIKGGRIWFVGIALACPYIICYCLENNRKSIRIYSSCGEFIEKAALPSDLMIESAVFFPCTRDCNRCHFYVLISKHCCYSYILDCVLECDELCESICDCNYEICDKSCHCHQPCDHANSCCDVLESIALVQASVAHILNAEGEKIQKALCSTNNICKILDVNKSVNSTIVRATNLEQLLFCNLEALNECCKPCNDNECCNPCNNCCCEDEPPCGE